MRLKAGILPVLVLLLSSGMVMGQGGNSGNSVRISVEVEEGLESYIEPIMDQVEENLALHGVDVAIVDADAQVDITIYTSSNASNAADATSWLTMQANTPTELLLSPLLYAQTEALHLSWNRLASEWGGKAREKAVADWVSGLALYSINRCGFAFPYLLEVVYWIAEINTYLAFYAGNCALMNGDLEGAAHLFNSGWYHSDDGIEMNPSTINLGWTLLQREDGEDWDLQHGVDWPLRYIDCQWMGEVLCDPPSRVDQLVRIAQLYALAFDYDEAIARMDRVIAFAERNMRTAIRVDAETSGDFTRTDVAELHTLRGQTWLLLYEWDRVLADYNRAIALDPAYPDAYFYRGVLYYSVLQAGLSWREDALNDFNHYLELAPDGDLAQHAQEYADLIHQELNALNN